MPALDELMRKVRSAIPFMGQDSKPFDDPRATSGWAQTRLGHNDMYSVPDSQFPGLASQFGMSGAEGFTTNDKPTILDHLLGMFGSSPIMRSAQQGPTVVAPQSATGDTIRHEAIHAFLRGSDKKVPAANVNNLIPQEGIQSLSRFYSPQEIAQEFPARASQEPQSMQMKPDEGKAAMMQYLTMLKRVDPAKAATLQKYIGYGQSPGSGSDSSYQKPNDLL